MKYFVLLTVFLIGSPAMAAEIAPKTPTECKILKEHVPRDDVIYRPENEIKRKGNAAVPADINAVPFELPDVLAVPLSINLAERLQNSNITGLLNEADLGILEFHKNGHVTYNGQDWTSQIYALCGQDVPRLSDGQDGSNPINSEPDKNMTAQEVAPLSAIPPR